MSEEPTPSVRLYDKDALAIEATQLVIKVYPSPDEGYFGHWYMDIPHENEDDEVDVDEIYALRDCTRIAHEQLEELLRMIEDQDFDES